MAIVIVNTKGMLSLLPKETLFVPQSGPGSEGNPLRLRGPGNTDTPLPPVGAMIGRQGEEPVFQVLSQDFSQGTPAVRGVTLRVLRAGSLPPGDIKCAWNKPGPSLAWITLSDKGSRGEREDKAGPLIQELMEERFTLSLARGFVIPDDQELLMGLLSQLALVQGFDYILTTGGTGVGPRDVTPEATLGVIQKRLPGFERAMTSESLAKTPHAMISRAVAGTLGRSIILNMPGSPKAVRETLTAVLPAMGHALEKLQGDPSDCGAA